MFVSPLPPSQFTLNPNAQYGGTERWGWGKLISVPIDTKRDREYNVTHSSRRGYRNVIAIY